MGNLKILLMLSIWISFTSAVGQNVQAYIYKDRRIINSWSTEVLPKRVLDFRVGHRFGDFSGSGGGWKTFYGLENASDISIGFDYGMLEDVTVGLHRTKGAGPLSQLINGHIMWRITSRGTERPSSLGIMVMSTMSTMPKSENSSSLSYFPKFQHRFLYYSELVGAKRFNAVLSGSLGLNVVHHNYVQTDRESNLFAMTAGLRIQLSRSFALLGEVTYPISRFGQDEDYHFPLGFGLEWETGGGHIFQVNLINARGLSETDYIPYSRSDWREGGFRVGFTIARKFRI
ncbi:hypothetical protein KUV50_06125 [Membranicola marinus]|uniref:DUF5777 domain-containing protein n=1 Tax=Membranihabitans marinus TaxID=1227546 RepID=A0A953HL72_9BACT|nr:DUF5777 family beta-barrel protein [Membranihabitans marinus]MBY5957697.1 hypothetical protein [Membranihabitans marinus]